MEHCIVSTSHGPGLLYGILNTTENDLKYGATPIHRQPVVGMSRPTLPFHRTVVFASHLASGLPSPPRLSTAAGVGLVIEATSPFLRSSVERIVQCLIRGSIRSLRPGYLSKTVHSLLYVVTCGSFHGLAAPVEARRRWKDKSAIHPLIPDRPALTNLSQLPLGHNIGRRGVKGGRSR